NFLNFDTTCKGPGEPHVIRCIPDFFW
ncbi:hypothetical protein DBR06_SOUSAS7310075, partial [Sousa chinensis]